MNIIYWKQVIDMQKEACRGVHQILWYASFNDLSIEARVVEHHSDTPILLKADDPPAESLRDTIWR